MLRRRSCPRPPLELLASAAPDVAAAGLHSTGLAAMCCRPVSGPSFAATRERLRVSTGSHARLVHWEWDAHGRVWALLAGPSLRRLATAAASIERVLGRDGFGGLLLWTVHGLHDSSGRPVQLVYDHRSRLFSPFAPCAGGTRDHSVEQAVAAALPRLPLEADPAQWTPLWDSPLIPD